MSTIPRNNVTRVRTFRALVAAILEAHDVKAVAAPLKPPTRVSAQFAEESAPEADVAVQGRSDLFLTASASLAQNRYLTTLETTEQQAALAGAANPIHVAYRDRRDGKPDGVALMSLDTLGRILAGRSSP